MIIIKKILKSTKSERYKIIRFISAFFVGWFGADLLFKLIKIINYNESFQNYFPFVMFILALGVFIICHWFSSNENKNTYE